ncbi:MAG: hypothetical protein ABS44_00750 [Chryseobacterium sp. SCN 40-13]|nr:MAG: hypothetical protein ABS44_00750 [Chryseobacterium sp. SCN 40-13]OJV52028.1 MAG: hypothetical protein BGO31_10145 [Bacteroidetes bacterium 43-16]
MNRNVRKILLGIISLSLLFAYTFVASCDKKSKGGEADGKALDRKALFVNYTANYILPGYQALKTDIIALQEAAAGFTAAPDAAKLSILRDSWYVAYLSWQKVDMLEFGPAEKQSLRSFLNIYPVTTSKVEQNVSVGNYNLETFNNYDAQGFPALDYLLNGLGSDDASVIAYYTTHANAQARISYLNNVIAKMLEKVSAVHTEWQSYQTDFINATGTDVEGSLSKMVNAFVLYYERFLRSGKIGYPVGAMTAQPLPTHCESYYSPGNGKAMAVTALQSVIAFYEGKSFDGGQSGKGMKTYLAAIATKDDDGTLMSEVISTELNAALTALNGVNGTLRDGVVNNRAAILGVYDLLQKAVASLKVDMVSAFGISITYVDNDGD